ncbi:unnamed protein product, partial [marine sediment metagenome]
PSLKSLKNDFFSLEVALSFEFTEGILIISNGISAIKNVTISIHKICSNSKNNERTAANAGPIS